MNDMSDGGAKASPSDILSGGSMHDGGGAVTGTNTPKSNESTACSEEAAHAPTGSEQELRAEIKRRDQAIIGLRTQIIAARMDAARLRRELEVVYSSRSWRLTRAYRAIGQAMTALTTVMQRRRYRWRAAVYRAKHGDLRSLPWHRWKRQQDMSSPRALRTLSVKEIRGPCVTYDRLIESRDAGYAELFPTGRMERTGNLRLEGPTECAPQLDALRDCFTDTGYSATSVTLTRLKDVMIDLPSGVCVTADGVLVDETAQVARGLEPSLASVAFISLSDNTFAPDGWLEVAEPLLHCFHPAAKVYGHFLFDVLPIVLLFGEAIRAGRMKMLMPRFPNWGLSTLRAFGIERRHILYAPREAIRCGDLLVPDTLLTLNTFMPNPGLCGLPAKAMGVGIATPWKSRDASARIYLSREGQPNQSDRDIENEEDVRAVLRTLGFTVLEPANMTFKDQVNAINGASVIVGVHGSGFANLMFARPGTLVIDLMPQDWIGFWGAVGSPERWLLNVTTAFSLDYTILLCRSQLIGRGMMATVDLGLLRQVICGHDADRRIVRAADAE